MPDPRPIRTRRRLLDAARRLIAENGIAALRIADITREAGVAIGSFQNHFSSKEDLVTAVAREAIETLAAEIVDEPNDDAPSEVAIAALRRFVRLTDDDPAFCALLVNLSDGEELFVESIRPFAHAALERAAATGAFVIEDVDLAVTFIVSGALGVIRRRLDGLAAPDADIRLARLVLLGLQVDPAEAERLANLQLPRTAIIGREPT